MRNLLERKQVTDRISLGVNSRILSSLTMSILVHGNEQKYLASHAD
jgi:hypothetical protein